MVSIRIRVPQRIRVPSGGMLIFFCSDMQVHLLLTTAAGLVKGID